MIHLQGLTKYRERGEREQKIQTELCFCASSIFHFLYGLCGQVLETKYKSQFYLHELSYKTFTLE